MNYFIVATHSKLAEGMVEMIDFFVKDLKNIVYINAYVESQNFEEEFKRQLALVPENANLCVCTDLKGGSVNQTAMKHMREYKYFLVSGINLPILLSLVLNPTELDSDTINGLVEECRKELIHIEMR